MATQTTFTKQVNEERIFTIDFSKKMSSAEIISTIDSTSSDPAELTFPSNAIVGQTVEQLVAGGSLPTRTDLEYKEYKVTVTITTDLAQILENEIFVRVTET